MLKGLLALAACLVANLASAADAALIEAARREGKVVWYSTLIVDQSLRPLAAAFEAKYPGVKVEYLRQNSSDIVRRIMAETKAGSPQADVFDGNSALQPLKQAGRGLKWLPESAKAYPAGYVDPEGYWGANHVTYISIAINTDLVPKAQRPKTFDDLLDPRWKGKMVWSTAPDIGTAASFTGNVLAVMGQDNGMAYLRKLAQQNVVASLSSTRQILDQTMAGEYAISLQAWNHHVLISALKGAPVAWIPLDPVPSTASITAMTTNAPHPNAGKLLMDFVLSEEGQKIFVREGYFSAHPGAPPSDPTYTPEGGGYKVRMTPPDFFDTAQLSRWQAIFKDIFPQ